MVGEPRRTWIGTARILSADRSTAREAPGWEKRDGRLLVPRKCIPVEFPFARATRISGRMAAGQRCWKQGRYGYGQLIAVNDLLLVQAEDGRVVLVRADRQKATKVAEIPALSDRTWNHPVVAAQRLIVRNDREAACYALPLVHNGSDLDSRRPSSDQRR